MQSVEISDIHIPAALAAAKVSQDNTAALHLRAPFMLCETIKENGAMVIVLAAVKIMGIGGMLATSTFTKGPQLPVPPVD